MELYVLGITLLSTNRKRIVGFALKSRLPEMYSNKDAVDAGGLIYYGASILRGAEELSTGFGTL